MLAPLAASMVQPVISSVVKSISGKGIRRAGIGYVCIKMFSSALSFKQYRDHLLFQL